MPPKKNRKANTLTPEQLREKCVAVTYFGESYSSEAEREAAAAAMAEWRDKAEREAAESRERSKLQGEKEDETYRLWRWQNRIVFRREKQEYARWLEELE